MFSLVLFCILAEALAHGAGCLIFTLFVPFLYSASCSTALLHTSWLTFSLYASLADCLCCLSLFVISFSVSISVSVFVSVCATFFTPLSFFLANGCLGTLCKLLASLVSFFLSDVRLLSASQRFEFFLDLYLFVCLACLASFEPCYSSER